MLAHNDNILIETTLTIAKLVGYSFGREKTFAGYGKDR
jgi:hypothetical protein